MSHHTKLITFIFAELHQTSESVQMKIWWNAVSAASTILVLTRRSIKHKTFKLVKHCNLRDITINEFYKTFLVVIISWISLIIKSFYTNSVYPVNESGDTGEDSRLLISIASQTRHEAGNTVHVVFSTIQAVKRATRVTLGKKKRFIILIM